MQIGTEIRAHTRPKGGFTLVELLVAIAITGLLLAILLPATQMSRETSRRIQCINNLRQQALAIHGFHDANSHLPAGRCLLNQQDYAWSAAVLPWLDQSNLWHQINFAKPWNDSPGNASAAAVSLTVYLCPTAQVRRSGDSHFGGVMGSTLVTTTTGDRYNGTLIFQSIEMPRPIRFSDLSDGQSNTIFIGETVHLGFTDGIEWADGNNCFLHGRPINSTGDGFGSLHPGGCHVAIADGSVRFLSQSIDNNVLSALCTRSGGESMQDL